MERNLPIGDDVRDGRSIWVIMKIYGREVPVELKPQEMKRQ
jgi:hypothetical protein